MITVIVTVVAKWHMQRQNNISSKTYPQQQQYNRTRSTATTTTNTINNETTASITGITKTISSVCWRRIMGYGTLHVFTWPLLRIFYGTAQPTLPGRWNQRPLVWGMLVPRGIMQDYGSRCSQTQKRQIFEYNTIQFVVIPRVNDNVRAAPTHLSVLSCTTIRSNGGRVIRKIVLSFSKACELQALYYDSISNGGRGIHRVARLYPFLKSLCNTRL